jgi:hypothetical protein
MTAMNDGKLTAEAIAVLEAACRTVDLDRASWLANGMAKAEEQSPAVCNFASAQALALSARANALRSAVELDLAVDAYRAANKPTV